MLLGIELYPNLHRVSKEDVHCRGLAGETDRDREFHVSRSGSMKGELSASCLDLLMIKIRTARRKFTKRSNEAGKRQEAAYVLRNSQLQFSGPSASYARPRWAK